MSITGNWKLGLLLSLSTTIMWGLLPLSLVPLFDVLDPYTITFYRLGGGGLLLFIWLVLRQHRPSKITFSPSISMLLAIAILGICGNYYFWLKGLDLTSPATAQVLIQIAPMLLILGSVVVFREAFSVKQTIGVVIFIVGLLLFFNQKLSNILNELSDYNQGIYYICLASFVWAVYALAQKKLLKHFKALELIFIIVTVGSLIILPLASPAKIMQLSCLQLWMLAFATVNTAVAYGCFTEAMRHWDTSRVSAVVATVPVVTLAVAYLQQLFFPTFAPAESINSISIVGATIVVIGSAITALSKQSTKTDDGYIDYD